MIWGLEGRHLWVPPSLVGDYTVAQYAAGEFDPSLGVCWINYRSDDFGIRVYPRFKAENIGGLRTTGDSGDTRDNRVRAQGEIPRRSFRRGKTITYSGLCQAQDRRQLREAEALMDAAFDDQSAEGLMVVTPHPLYDDSGEFRYFPAKALMAEIGDEIKFPSNRITGGHESEFVVSIRNARAGGVSYTDQDGTTYA